MGGKTCGSLSEWLKIEKQYPQMRMVHGRGLIQEEPGSLKKRDQLDQTMPEFHMTVGLSSFSCSALLSYFFPLLFPD